MTTEPTGILTEALQFVDKSESEPMDAATIDLEIEKRNRVLRTLLPIENGARHEINQEIAELNTQKRITLAINGPYRKFHLAEPLKWRRADGMPKLAVFSLADPVMAFEAEYIGGNWSQDHSTVKPNLPTVMLRCFNDVREKLYRESRERYRQTSSSTRIGKITASAKFTGLIPPEAKKEIEAAKQCFGNNIFLVAEAPQWKISEEVREVPIERKDPLVVGVVEDQIFYITKFDPTNLENLLQSEFLE